jgi:hypothetical protein
MTGWQASKLGERLMCQLKAIDAWCCFWVAALLFLRFFSPMAESGLENMFAFLVGVFAASLDLEGVEAYSFLFEDRISNDET